MYKYLNKKLNLVMEEKIVNNISYKMLSEGWPNVEKQPPSPNTVRSIFSIYSGRDSELTLMLEYIYNAMVLREQNEGFLSELFDAVANDQMQHLRHLGRLICRYGGEPRFISYIGGRGIPWSSGAIRHEKNINNILYQSINAERLVLNQHKALYNHMLDSSPKSLISRIMRNHEHHINIFEHALHNSAVKSKKQE